MCPNIEIGLIVTQLLLDKRCNSLIVPNLFFFQALVVNEQIEISFLHSLVRDFYPNMVIGVKSKKLFEEPYESQEREFLRRLVLGPYNKVFFCGHNKDVIQSISNPATITWQILRYFFELHQ